MLIGSDYIYPREANRVMRDLIERHGGEVLDEIYLPMDTPEEEIAALVARVRMLRQDAVFSTLVGSHICKLCEHYADAGIDPADIPIASHNVTEAELSTVNRAECAGHITAAPYFSSVDSDVNRAFVAAFRTHFGADQPVSQYAASAYSSVRLFASALELAGEMDTQRMMHCARGLELEAPHGRIVVDLDNNHTWMTPRVGIWNGRNAFDVVWESDQVVQPDPWLVSYGGVEDVAQSAVN
jgi:ABC-type branched-subunit amino acid transport system substrate-binding protein